MTFFFSPGESSFAAVLWCAFIGVSFALLYLFFMNRKKANYARALISSEAFSDDAAVGYEKLGFTSREKAKSALSSFAEEKDGAFFIPERKKAKADFIIRSAETKWWVLILSVAAVYIIMLVAYKYLPELVNTDINFV